LSALGAAVILFSTKEASPAVRGAGRHMMYLLTGNVKHIASTINSYKGALAVMAVDDPGRSLLLAALADALTARYARTGSQDDLEESLRFSGEAVNTSAVGSEGRIDAFTANVDALLARFNRFGERADIDSAIELARRAAAEATGKVDRASALDCLARANAARFEHTADDQDLKDAVEAADP